MNVVDLEMVARGCTELNIVDLKTVTHRPGSESRIITCVFQAGRLLLNGSDFSAFQNNFFGYTSYGVNLLDLMGFLAIQIIGSKPSRSNRVSHLMYG